MLKYILGREKRGRAAGLEMESLGKRDMQRLFRFAKTILLLAGTFLVFYGSWFMINLILTQPRSTDFWFGIFPVYIGCMLVLISFAMKEDWFTNARKYW